MEAGKNGAEAAAELDPSLNAVYAAIAQIPGSENVDPASIEIGSMIYANKPGDGSAREQAASCQKVLGGFANICYEFATKRYRSNCINWGIMPFTLAEGAEFPYSEGDYVYVEGIRAAIADGKEEFAAKVITAGGEVKDITLYVKGLTDDEREIILDGCLMNYYKNHSK
jgi:aconitate hydratase